MSTWHWENLRGEANWIDWLFGHVGQRGCISRLLRMIAQITSPQVPAVGWLTSHILTRFWESISDKVCFVFLQDASSADIRKAYRKLSLILHPDKNKDENAETQFRQVSDTDFNLSLGGLECTWLRCGQKLRISLIVIVKWFWTWKFWSFCLSWICVSASFLKDRI